MKRREFLWLSAAGFFAPSLPANERFPVQFRQQPPYASLLPFAEPGHDEFPGEKLAMEIAQSLGQAMQDGALPLEAVCQGASPLPQAYSELAPDVRQAVYGSGGDIREGWRQWRESLGKVRQARFYPLADDLIRYEISSEQEGRQQYRVGMWKQKWRNGKLSEFKPIQETVTHGAQPWFRDVTAAVFAGVASFPDQLARGVPYWRARLDPATGIDLYGSNGIAVGDIDNDGQDEIYVCQPGGLPNRLYKLNAAGHMEDITQPSGVGILDDTACALFLDLRNTGRQDLVILRSSGPLLFLNDGQGRFTHVPDAFRFAHPPQGGFTGMAAADYDRDGRLDLYLCCYVYFQSEAQYRYPVPYHDAKNGPPNFLFHNRLDAKGGYFEDVTAATGLNENNNRYSFAPAWCDTTGSGWPDLYVSNDFGRNNFYRNEKGHFRDKAAESGVDDLGPGMSAAWFDYDGDGKPDLYVANMWSDAGQRVVRDKEFAPAQAPGMAEAYRHHTKGNSLYRNLGEGRFEYAAAKEGVEMGRWAWSSDGHDFDNDGTPEILITCGMLTNKSEEDLMSFFWRQVISRSPITAKPAPAYENGWNAINQMIREDASWSGRQPNVFYARRAGQYRDFSGISGLDYPEDGRAFAVTDFDGDGNLDILLKNRLGPQLRVLQNQCGINRKVIAFSLEGTKSNRDAIGAKVEVDGQVKWLAAGSGYLSQHTKRLHFGLANKTRAEKVRITWPSGSVQELGPLEPGACYTIKEDGSDIKSKPFQRRQSVLPEHAVPADNSMQLHTTWFREAIPLPEPQAGPALLIVQGANPEPPPAGVPVRVVDLTKSPADTASAYALFRRYLFDWRTSLETPLSLLIDDRGQARKIYAAIPDAATVRTDLQSLTGKLPEPRALPFPGRYFSEPHRDYYKLGAAFLGSGYPDFALPYLEEMLRRSPDSAKTLMAIGRIHLMAKRLPQAREALQQAARIDPMSAEIWNEWGGVEDAAGNATEAMRLYEKALSINPDLTYALMNAAQSQAKTGNKEEAAKIYRRVLQLDSQNSDAADALGLLAAQQGRTDEARRLFEQAIASRRDNASAINNLGVLYLQIGQTNDAIAAFRYGIQVAPAEETLYLNLGRIYARTGDREKAREIMRELLTRKPESAIAQKALKELEAP